MGKFQINLSPIVTSLALLSLTLTLSACNFQEQLAKQEEEKKNQEAVEELSRDMEALKKEWRQEFDENGEISTDLDDIHEKMKKANIKFAKKGGKEAKILAKMNIKFLNNIKGAGKRLDQALVPASSERFLNLATMLQKDDFQWNLNVSKEYLAAATVTKKLIEEAPDFFIAEVKKSKFSEEKQKEILPVIRLSVTESWAPGLKFHSSHCKMAQAYTDYIQFVQKNKQHITVNKQQEVEINDNKILEKHDELAQLINNSKEELQENLSRMFSPSH